MYVQLANIGSLFQFYRFEPAKVQRQYVWGRDESLTLIGDLADAWKSKAFYHLGPVIFASGQSPWKVFVYDGQQRLTTLTILLAAMSRLLPEDAQDPVRSLTGFPGRPRIDLRTRGGALTRVVNRTETYGAANNTPVDYRIYGNLRALTDYMSAFDQEQVASFLEWILSDVALNLLWADRRGDGVTLFARANNRGVRLEWHDLVKGEIIDAFDHRSVASDSFQEHWYRTSRDVGREFPDLVWSLAVERYGNPAEQPPCLDSNWAQVNFEDDFEPESQTAETLVEKRDTLIKQLQAYRDTGSKLDAVRGLPAPRTTADTLRAQLLSLEHPHWKPLLYAGERRHPDGGVHEAFLKALRRTAFIAHLLGWPSFPQRLDWNLLQALRSVRSGVWQESGLVQFTEAQLAQARGALYSGLMDDRFYRPLVKLYEIELASMAGCFEPKRLFRSHVEHVLPRAPRDDWLDRFPDENERAECRNLLGNYCLLDPEVNVTLGNGAWDEKRAVYATQLDCYVGAREIATRTVWNAKVVRERTDQIALKIKEVLELGDEQSGAAVALPSQRFWNAPGAGEG